MSETDVERLEKLLEEASLKTKPLPNHLEKLLEEGGLTAKPLANQLQAVARVIIRSALRCYPRQLDLSFHNAVVIGGIGTFGPLTGGDLAVLLTMHEGQLSRTIAKLAKMGVVERVIDPSDARRKLLMLTKEGKKLYRRIITIQKRREAELLKGISEKEWENFMKTLEHIRANADAVLVTESRKN